MSQEAVERALQLLLDTGDGMKPGIAQSERVANDVLALAAALADTERERDDALARVKAHHDDVRKACERAEDAFRQRDAAEARVRKVLKDANSDSSAQGLAQPCGFLRFLFRNLERRDFVTRCAQGIHEVVEIPPSGFTIACRRCGKELRFP